MCRKNNNIDLINSDNAKVIVMSDKLSYEELEKRIVELEQTVSQHRQSEYEFNQIFAMSLDMLCVADINTATFLKVNPAFTETLGYSEGELLEKPFSEFIHPEDIDSTHSVIEEKLLLGAKVINFENRYRCKDGSYRWLSWMSHPTPERGVTYAVARDITENKLAEKKVLLKQKQLQAISKIGKLANSTLNLDGVLESILKSTIETLDASAGMIFLKDPVTGCLSWGTSSGLSKAFVSDFQNYPIQPGEGMTGHIAHTGDPVYIAFDSSHDPRIVRSSIVEEGLNSFIGVPLSAANKIVGVMNILTRPPDILSEDDLYICAAVGSHVGMAIRNAQLFDRHKQAEKTLSESEKRFRELFNNMSSGVAIYDAVKDGNDFIFKDINQAGLASSQLEYHQFVGKSVQEIFPGIREMGLFKVFQRVWKTGTPEHFPSAHYKDNRITLWVENYVCKIPSGEIVAIYEDITDRKKTEDALIRAKEEWALTFDAMSDIVTIQDKDMHIVRANKAAHDFFQKNLGELNGKHCYEIFTGMSVPCHGCPLLNTLEDIGKHSGIIHHKNLGRTFLVSSAVIVGDDGKLQYLVHVAKDITDQKRLEEELFQAHKMEAMGTLAGGIAHDFNNILSAIIGYAELALLDIPDDNHAIKDINQVLQSSKRAADLVQQILTFSRKSSHQLQSLMPHVIIKEALKMLHSSLPTTLSLEEKIAPDCGAIMADPTNVHQIVVNLCTNAFHAMENEKGVLTVSLCRKDLIAEQIHESDVSPGPYVVLSVSDTGQGMDKKTIERIFEPYFTTKEVGKGSGLGLAVIHGIVKSYKGFIQVESELGKGSIFHVHFPALEQVAATQEKVEEQPLLTGTERILVVDDEAFLVRVTQRQLENLGYRVTGTTDSNDALEKIRTDPDGFDILITDQTMPGLTGAELAVGVKEINPGMLIILCTGHSSTLTKEKSLALGIDRYIGKPIIGNVLPNTVRELLDEK